MNDARRARRFVPLLGLLLGGALVVAACTSQPKAASAERSASGIKCDPILLSRFGSGRTSQVVASPPKAMVSVADTVLVLDTIDLDCDGTVDYVGQIVPARDGRPSRRPTLMALVHEGDSLRTVLWAPSPVDGLEGVAIAADLSGTRKRDLVTVGHDEGGYVPRVFRWQDHKYAPVRVPAAYRLREEAAWSAECLLRINPKLGVNGELLLLRETISPSETRGHGTSCDLPEDTLHVVGDSLVRVTSR